MKLSRKMTTAAVALTSVLGVGAVGVAAHAASTLPAEQQALVTAGYTNTGGWKFTKQDGACRVTVEAVGKNYYVLTTGKMSAEMYPVRANHVVDAAALMDANCQG